ncbi:MAG TPA: hypothetical protein PKL15_08670 [Saprospiraceae bacterium]|nr:hypothetical protein [Saprospiraceae bacterium]HNM25488.1 hypothetical protein [Saprospiraceae bacterium]
MKKALFFLLVLAWIQFPYNTNQAALNPAPVLPEQSCNLAAPSTFTTDRTSSNTADLTWSSVSGAIAYRLLVYEIGTPNTLVGDTIEYGTSKTLNYLQSGKSYRCYLSSVCPDNSVSSFIIIVDIIE